MKRALNPHERVTIPHLRTTRFAAIVGLALGCSIGGAGGGPGGRVDKMFDTVLTAAGVPTDSFGDASLPKGIFSERVA